MAPIGSLGRIGPETSADSLGRLVRTNSDTIRVRQAIPTTHSKVRTNRFLSVGCGSCILIFYVLLKTLSARYFPIVWNPMTWSVTIEKGRGSERTGVRSVRTLVVVSPESLETAGGVQKTQALPFRISIHPEAYTCIPVILTDDHPAINCCLPTSPSEPLFSFRRSQSQHLRQ
jgi:hypothetical protein